jgi:hypothetical protein
VTVSEVRSPVVFFHAAGHGEVTAKPKAVPSPKVPRPSRGTELLQFVVISLMVLLTLSTFLVIVL